MKPLLILAAGLIAPGLAFAGDLTGAWKVDSSVGKTPIVVNCSLVQSGDALSGSCAPATGDAGPTALTGKVAGTHATWGYDVVFKGAPAHVGYAADITSDTAMTGVLELSGKPSPFTATKQ